MTPRAAVAAVVAACLRQVLPNAAEVAAGSVQPEHVHQLRVGLRRLRTALRELGHGQPVPFDWEPAVRDAFSALGAARDRHVLRATLVPLLEGAGAPLADPAAAAGAGEPAESELMAHAGQVVRSTAFQSALLGLLAFAYAPAITETPDTDASVPAPAAESERRDDPRTAATARLRHLHRQVAQAAERFEALDIAGQHRVRKRLKRLRYLAEFVASLYKTRRVEGWLKALEPAQDALGRHIDRATAAARFERLAPDDPRAWFAAGWLRAGLDETARDARRSLARFARAAVFW